MTLRRNPLAIALTGLALAAPSAHARPVTKAEWGPVADRPADAEVDWASVTVGAWGGAALATLAALGLGAAGRARPAV